MRRGSRVVVGCGLGDDVAELLSRGYDAVGFDVSPTAIGWARPTWMGVDYPAMKADPAGGMRFKDITNDTVTFKLGIGI